MAKPRSIPAWTNDPYQLRWRKSNGPRKPKTLLERFEAKLLPGPPAPAGLPGDCWEWRAGHFKKTGYALICVKCPDGKWRPTVAHRVAYELFIAEIPPGLHIDHLCRNRGCVNPWHLEPVTQEENNRRALLAAGWLPGAPEIAREPCAFRNWSRPGWDGYCGNGHLITAENTHVRANGQRECWTCIRERDNKRNKDRKEHYRRMYQQRKRRRLDAA